MNDLKPKFDLALNKFTEKHKKNKNVIAILVTGSYIHSKPDKNSDLDVCIVVNESETRERGNTWINGVEIEYFINPIKQVRHSFATEIDSPQLAHMFANSKVVFKRNNTIDDLIKEAKTILKKPLKKMSKFQVENGKYHLDDFEKDLEDVFAKSDEFAFHYVSLEILNECIDLFYKIHRVQREKSKRLFSQMKKLDSKFAQQYSHVLNQSDMQKKFSELKKLIHYVEKLLGGKRTKEWKLKGKCTF